MSPDEIRPANLFIVGAPKCGTTSLYEYLRQHPQIFFPDDHGTWGRAKEPNYFCADLDMPSRHALKDRDAYLALYRDAGAARWRGDASTNYLSSPGAPAAIRAASPDARILIMLRPPVDMMRSYHSELVRHGHEDISDFHAAVAASPERRAGRRIPADTAVPKGLDYVAMARFAPQVAHWFETFGRDAVKVLLLEDMVAAPAATLRDVLGFLDVDASFQPEFRIHNETPRSGLAERAARALYRHSGLQFAGDRLPYEFKRTLLRSLRRVDHAREHDGRREQALREQCRADVVALAALIGRNLDHWQVASR